MYACVIRRVRLATEQVALWLIACRFMLLSFLGFDSDQAIAISSVYKVLAFEVFRGGYYVLYIGSRYA
jgi:hypothetical protein